MREDMKMILSSQSNKGSKSQFMEQKGEFLRTIRIISCARLQSYAHIPNHETFLLNLDGIEN